MNLASDKKTVGETASKRRLSIQFMPSSPVYVQVRLRPAVSGPARRPTASARGASAGQPLPQKNAGIGFYLEAPNACGVKLAADFTDWEKSPVAMTSVGHGLWRVVIPLPPGRYSYRFIVDGQWCGSRHSLKSLADVSVTAVP